MLITDKHLFTILYGVSGVAKVVDQVNFISFYIGLCFLPRDRSKSWKNIIWHTGEASSYFINKKELFYLQIFRQIQMAFHKGKTWNGYFLNVLRIFWNNSILEIDWNASKCINYYELFQVALRNIHSINFFVWLREQNNEYFSKVFRILNSKYIRITEKYKKYSWRISITLEYKKYSK